MRKLIYIILIAAIAAMATIVSAKDKSNSNGEKAMKTEKRIKSEEELQKSLSQEQYLVLRKAATERPFSGKYNNFWERGIYNCPVCGTPLFSSETKYEHGTGWPSFSAPIDLSKIKLVDDYSYGMHRIEVKCATCGSHLGHVFDDGPGVNGKHYCINSLSLDFKKNEAVKEELADAYFAGGCFWGIEYKFGKIDGVVKTEVGYSGGKTENPTYEEVCSDTTGHAESIKVTYNPSKISYKALLRHFFTMHDPTTKNRQGPDIGTQYRSAIFYSNLDEKKIAESLIVEITKEKIYSRAIVTEIAPAGKFYPAESYHQKYIEKKNGHSCAQ